MDTQAITEQATTGDDWILNGYIEVLGTLPFSNYLACTVAFITGLRIGDVLNLRTQEVAEEMDVIEQKTRKTRHITLPRGLVDLLVLNGNAVYCFPHRDDPMRHKTRQAVWHSFRRYCRQVNPKLPAHLHILRSAYCLTLLQNGYTAEKVKTEIGHSNVETTRRYLEKLQNLKTTTVENLTFSDCQNIDKKFLGLTNEQLDPREV